MKVIRDFGKEKVFADWFERNYFKLGFDCIVDKRHHYFPDYIMYRQGKRVGVELETKTSHFWRHGHDPSKVDIVVCLEKNCEISNVEIIEAIGALVIEHSEGLIKHWEEWPKGSNRVVLVVDLEKLEAIKREEALWNLRYLFYRWKYI